jgi:hypothetical protein
VPYPAAVYDVLGALRAAVAGLDQTLRQSANRLVELAAIPHARQSDAASVDGRWPPQANPRDTAFTAAVNLHSALVPLDQAADALGVA